ncbi:hypothetical protein L211DRAFT_841186 [Terfezia boudieri ATCC MYA-4762]|uniref:Uncharacterized protein n=1 Tax=Terfezia boudieri ATCC MYA-4762 TaxID=1051890 RepID=A0A3N4LDV0_9PEZI|nr:hypothetical protein L211DRAFT_841186 [Terfezia boudieri ATCC MYA-4762]
MEVEDAPSTKEKSQRRHLEASTYNTDRCDLDFHAGTPTEGVVPTRLLLSMMCMLIKPYVANRPKIPMLFYYLMAMG